MSAVGVSKAPVSVINVITVTPQVQDAAVKAVEQMLHQVMRRQPGFLSAAVYRSLDGRRVTVHAQWESENDFQRISRHPAIVNHMRQFLEVAQPEWHVYERVYSTTAGA
jgi:heme-degrading monooxygenase HmoA